MASDTDTITNQQGNALCKIADVQGRLEGMSDVIDIIGSEAVIDTDMLRQMARNLADAKALLFPQHFDRPEKP